MLRDAYEIGVTTELVLPSALIFPFSPTLLPSVFPHPFPFFLLFNPVFLPVHLSNYLTIHLSISMFFSEIQSDDIAQISGNIFPRNKSQNPTPTMNCFQIII